MPVLTSDKSSNKSVIPWVRISKVSFQNRNTNIVTKSNKKREKLWMENNFKITDKDVDKIFLD